MSKAGIFLVILACTTVGCAGGSGTRIKDGSCPSPSARSSDYIIGPGDKLNIVVWRNDELSAQVPVRPDGRISTPLIDDMQASGKTPSALGNDMEKVLGEYLRTPEVSVIVTGQGAANQIQIIGEVNNPQSLSYRDGLSLLDALVTVGGLSDFAAGNRSNLIRQTENGQVECRVRLKDLMSGDISKNQKVFPGDVIVVPETRF